MLTAINNDCNSQENALYKPIKLSESSKRIERAIYGATFEERSRVEDDDVWRWFGVDFEKIRKESSCSPYDPI